MYSVLVVEDDPAAQQLVTTAFAGEDEFFITALVKTADAALAVADVEHIDVVVLDDRLEGPKRGSSIVSALRELQPHAAIIIWSAYDATRGNSEADARVPKDEPVQLVDTARRLVS